MNSYEQHQADRRDRLEAAAERAQSESDAAYTASRRAVAGIECGQPILVGHHSEKRHRSALRRADEAMRRSVAASKRAEELSRRADAVGAAGISSDDPDAVAKLRAQLATLETTQEQMKRMNAAWRKAGRPIASDPEGWQRVAGILGLAPTDLQIREARTNLATDFISGRPPYPGYATANNSANIRRIEDRITTLEQRRQDETRETEIGGVTIRDDVEENRVCVEYPRNHPHFDALRAGLKTYSFKWSPTRGAWVRMRGGSAYDYALAIVRRAVGEGTPNA